MDGFGSVKILPRDDGVATLSFETNDPEGARQALARVSLQFQGSEAPDPT